MLVAKKLTKFDAVAKKVRRVAMKVTRVATKVVRMPHEIDCRQRDKMQATYVAKNLGCCKRCSKVSVDIFMTFGDLLVAQKS